MDKMKKPQEKIDLDKEVRNIGIALIVLGVIHFVLSQFLDFTWGFVLIAVGVISLFYRSRKMLLTFGILLIVVGVLNISSYAMTLEETSGFWGIFGIVQIVWGIKEINRFRRTRENPKYEIKEKIKKSFVWYGLRAGFWTMIGLWAISIFLSGEENLYFAFWVFWIASVIFTFVLSIIHLTRYKQKALAVTSLVFASFLILTAIIGLVYYGSYDYTNSISTQNQIISNNPQNVAVSGTLSTNYAEYREFADQTTTAEVDLKFSSDYPISVYFVPSEIDYEKFMKNEAYNSYQGCSFESKSFYEISCNVSTGGIIIYNPSYYTANYEIS